MSIDAALARLWGGLPPGLEGHLRDCKIVSSCALNIVHGLSLCEWRESYLSLSQVIDLPLVIRSGRDAVSLCI